MAPADKVKATGRSTIVLNRKARHNYFIEQCYEAGLVLQGWEVKSIRSGRAQINESYVLLQGDEAFLFGATITPLPSVSTHLNPEPTRQRKLLLRRHELDRLIGAVERKSYTLVPLALYWRHGHIKLEIGLARGKKAYDKRAATKEKDWQREKQRLRKIIRQ